MVWFVWDTDPGRIRGTFKNGSMTDTVTWKIGGEAGFGIMTTGVMFSRLATRHGYRIWDYAEYPSLIRGGHNVYEVCVGREAYSQEHGVDLLVALNRETVTLHQSELKTGGVLVYDPAVTTLTEGDVPEGKTLFPVPMDKLVQEAGISKLMVNNVALGVSAGMLGMDILELENVIADSFGRKGGDIITENQKAARLGFDFAVANAPQTFTVRLPRIGDEKRMVISGNEAVVLGAVAAGCQLYAAYPMTPTSNALHYFAALSEEHGIVVKHVEDEIAAINVAIGAGYAGVRAMTGTSGGGFSLMVEGLGLAGITETPLVILMGMRPGPATGMPTWTGQGDLKFLIHAAQDEFPRIVLAPGDMEEAFYMTMEAFNLADRYQTPVFILTDKYIAEGHQSVPVYDPKRVAVDRGKLLSWEDGETATNYLRYRVTDDGLPVRALPGMKSAVFTANSYEHDEYGYSTEDASERVKQVDRRSRKMDPYRMSIPRPAVYGPAEAELTLVGWGSTVNPGREAIRRLTAENYPHPVNYVHFSYIWPFPEKHATELLQSAKRLVLLEGNAEAQLGSLIREYTGVFIMDTYLRYDGRPFYPDDIVRMVKERFS